MESNIIETLNQYDAMMVSVLTESRCFKHTHPPIRGIDTSCLYCRIHGNVFSDGVVQINPDELCKYVIPITNAREAIPIR